MDTQTTEQQAYKQAYLSLIQGRICDDDAARDAVDLRIAMVKLIADIGELIDDTAAALQFKRSKSEYNPFEVDELRDIVSWQVAEFVTQAHYPRHDESYEYVVRGKQYSTDHAAFWFDVLEGYGDPPEFYVQDHRTPAPADDDDEQEADDTGLQNSVNPLPADDDMSEISDTTADDTQAAGAALDPAA